MSSAAGEPEAGWEPSSAELARRSDPQVGTAYAVSVRTDADPANRVRHETVLTFRLRRLGADGRELPPVAVEMRGPVLSGMIAEGDEIKLPAPVPHGGALRLTTVSNVTTQSEVTTKSGGGLPMPAQVAILVIFGVLFLVVLGLIIATMVSMDSPF